MEEDDDLLSYDDLGALERIEDYYEDDYYDDYDDYDEYDDYD